MTTALPSGQPDEELEAICTRLLLIKLLVDEALKRTDSRFETEGEMYGHAWGVVRQHADRLCNHSAAMAEWIGRLNSPLPLRLFAAADSGAIGDPPAANTMVETETAYDQDKLDTLSVRDIRDAAEFNTEMKDTFGLAWMDDEIAAPLTDAFDKFLVLMEDGNSTIPGMMVQVMKVLLKGHPRAFGRYYSGTDPWPRPSAVIQAEIDYRMPDALNWLRHELTEALEQEAAAAKPNGGDDER